MKTPQAKIKPPVNVLLYYFSTIALQSTSEQHFNVLVDENYAEFSRLVCIY